MENFTFWSPTEFVFGKDTQKETGKLVVRYGGYKVMICYGGGSVVKSGLLKEVEDSLRQAGLEYVEFGGIQPNPIADKVYEGIGVAVKEGVNMMLAVGGGSVIDTAKAIALGAVYPGDFWDFYSGKQQPVAALPIGVVLTIPAAGSEGSGNSVITKFDDKGRHKISVRYPMILRPRFAVMNPELTYTLPWFQTACGVVDMLCHIYERYFSNTDGTELVDSYSEAIMRSVMDCALRIKVNETDYDARANVMWAGTLAHNGLCGVGKAEDWASHRLEHEVSAFYDVAHGAGLAVIVPAWMAFVAKKNPNKVWQFAINVMSVNPEGLSEEEVIAEGIKRLKEFYHDLGLTTSLRELVGKEPDIDAMTASLHQNMGDILGSYVPLTMDDCKEIYKMSL